MTPKASRQELLLARTLIEQEWAWRAKGEHLSYREMRIACNAQVRDGGLGYDLSESALKGLVAGYIERMREVHEHSPEVELALSLAELDEQHRRIKLRTEPIDQYATMLRAQALGYRTVDELMQHDPSLVVLRDERTILAAERELRSVNESRRTLLGSNAPTRATLDVDVTHHDAVAEELNDMLARLDPPKKKAKATP